MTDSQQNFRGILLEPSGGSATTLNEIDYGAMLYRFVFKRWYLYVGCVVILLGLAYVYLRTLQPRYEVTGLIAILEDKSQTYTEDMIRRGRDFNNAYQNVHNEIQQLTSFELMNSVVHDLELSVGYRTESFMHREAYYQDFPILVDSFATLTGEGDILADFRVEPQDYVTFSLYTGDSLLGNYAFDSTFQNKYGIFRFKLNGALPDPEENRLFISFEDPREVTESYQARLEAAFTSLNSTTIELKLEDAIPERGVAVLSRLMVNYDRMKRERNNEVALETLGFIDDRLAEVSSQLDAVEANLERYKLRNQIADQSTSDLDLVLRNVDQLGREKEDLNLQLSIIRSMEQALNGSAGKDQLIPINSAVFNSGQLPEMVKLYNSLILDRKELLITGQPANPMVVSINQKIESLRGSITSALANLEHDLDQRKDLIASQYDRSLGRLQSVPTKERALLDQSRQQGIIENLYVYLLQKKEETALAYVSNTTSAQIIDRPHAGNYPVSPNKKVWYFFCLVMGIGLPFSFSVVKEELLPRNVETVEDLKRAAPNHTVVGIVNRAPGKDKLKVLPAARSEVSDRFRSLRNNLQYSYPRGSNCFLVTSGGKEEGKSFISTNLAASFALARKRAVVVDFDFYNATVANYVGGKNGRGLSDYLSGELELEELVHPVDRVTNLHYIPAGSPGDNPGDLISNQAALANLFIYLREQYDIIVLDAPPVGILSDAVLLNAYVTATLYVVRAEATKIQSVRRTNDLFMEDRLVNPLLVLNGLRTTKADYYT
ncbi:MAG: polysaccharide biosynthesis tyrosine autokinase [Saprospiraceae bacterium]